MVFHSSSAFKIQSPESLRDESSLPGLLSWEGKDSIFPWSPASTTSERSAGCAARPRAAPPQSELDRTLFPRAAGPDVTRHPAAGAPRCSLRAPTGRRCFSGARVPARLRPSPSPSPSLSPTSKAPLKMASPAPGESGAQGCPAPSAEEQTPRPGVPGEEAASESEPAGAGPQVEEAAGKVAAALTWLLGEPVVWLGCRADELLSWKRPLRSLLAFLGANLLFW